MRSTVLDLREERSTAQIAKQNLSPQNPLPSMLVRFQSERQHKRSTQREDSRLPPELEPIRREPERPPSNCNLRPGTGWSAAAETGSVSPAALGWLDGRHIPCPRSANHRRQRLPRPPLHLRPATAKRFEQPTKHGGRLLADGFVIQTARPLHYRDTGLRVDDSLSRHERVQVASSCASSMASASALATLAFGEPAVDAMKFAALHRCGIRRRQSLHKNGRDGRVVRDRGEIYRERDVSAAQAARQAQLSRPERRRTSRGSERGRHQRVRPFSELPEPALARGAATNVGSPQDVILNSSFSGAEFCEERSQRLREYG